MPSSVPMNGHPSRAMLMLSLSAMSRARSGSHRAGRSRSDARLEPLPSGVGGLARDGFHPVLHLELLLLERGLFDLFLVAQDDLLGQHPEAIVELVMLFVQPAIFLVLAEERLPEGTGDLGHRHLPLMLGTSGEALRGFMEGAWPGAALRLRRYHSPLSDFKIPFADPPGRISASISTASSIGSE